MHKIVKYFGRCIPIAFLLGMHQVQMVCYAPVDQIYGISQSLQNIHPECNALNMLKCNTQNAMWKWRGHMEIIYAEMTWQIGP